MIERSPPVIPSEMSDAAADWVARRDAPGGRQLDQAFKTWLDSDPLHRRAYREAEERFRDTGLLAHGAFGGHRALPRAPFLMRHRTQMSLAGAAMAILVAIALVAVLRDRPLSFFVPSADAATLTTDVGEIRRVRLTDGSQVILDTQTTLEVRFSGRRRDVRLRQGRARFEVAAIGDRPFVVHTQAGDVVAKGTLFDVSVIRPIPIVTLFKGRVEIASREGQTSDHRLLRAGEQVAIGDRAAPSAIPTASAGWVKGMLAIDAMPLGEAIAAINRYNHVQIELGDGALAKRPITGAFHVRDPEGFAGAVAAMYNLDIVRPSPDILRLVQRAAMREIKPAK